jgi:ABC-2 type transport system ATP-binding protein
MLLPDARLTEVHSYFENGDRHLGYRRLLDAAIETADFGVYRETLRFCDWYDAAGGTEADGSELHIHVGELLAIIGRHMPAQNPGAPRIKLRASGVAKRFRSGRFSLSPVDVTLVDGQVTGIVGENGNGKTTLLRLLFGELKPDAGSIEYLYAPPAADTYTARSGIAFIPQRPQSWFGSLLSNLEYASAYAGYTGEENELWTGMIMARMGLRAFRTYDWSRISSGYKMRFELARTLLRRPQVLLLDEPLANLDMLAQQIILEDLRFLATSRSMPLSIMLSSQQLYEVEKVSDAVLFLRQGVPQYRADESDGGLVIELETPATREELQELLKDFGLERQSFNGGIYILYFRQPATLPAVLEQIGRAQLPVKYIRDISHSSRRFFVA